MNIDFGAWLNNAKILVPVTEILKLPTQRAKFLDVLGVSHVNFAQDKTPEVSYQDAPIYLQKMESDNKDHQLFFVTLMVNGYKVIYCKWTLVGFPSDP